MENEVHIFGYEAYCSYDCVVCASWKYHLSLIHSFSVILVTIDVDPEPVLKISIHLGLQGRHMFTYSFTHFLETWMNFTLILKEHAEKLFTDTNLELRITLQCCEVAILRVLPLCCPSLSFFPLSLVYSRIDFCDIIHTDTVGRMLSCICSSASLACSYFGLPVTGIS